MRTTDFLTITVGFYLASVLGCNASKVTATDQNAAPPLQQVDEEAIEVQEDEYVFGTVTTAYESDGCNYLIHLKEPIEQTKFLLPIGLDEEFLTNGMELKFTFIQSRAPSGNCYIGMPAILSNIRSL
jgi:hypothetical protein